MKLIAVLGVLFVLASCSDSDIPENFGVSCYLDDKTYRYFFEFDFVFTSNIGFIQIYLPFDIDLKRPGRG